MQKIHVLQALNLIQLLANLFFEDGLSNGCSLLVQLPTGTVKDLMCNDIEI